MEALIKMKQHHIFPWWAAGGITTMSIHTFAAIMTTGTLSANSGTKRAGRLSKAT